MPATDRPPAALLMLPGLEALVLSVDARGRLESVVDLPADVVEGRGLDRRRVCRTFSDCTTAPRNGLVSGCYPLDAHYGKMPARVELTRAKRAAEQARGGRRS